MARPQAFDRQQALAAAMTLFWRQGFHASSVQQLLDAMGINRGSLYGAFGDKQALFCEALALYQQHVQAWVVQVLEQASDPVEAIEQVFRLGLVQLPEEQRRWGCLLVNTVNELAPLEPSLAALAQAKLDKVGVAFASAVTRARLEGRVSDAVTDDEAAHLLMTAMTGLRVQAREGASVAQLDTALAPLFRLLFREQGQ